MEKAWDFIQHPENLNQITPDDMDFEICSPIPNKMYDGLIVEYRIQLPVIGRRTWVSELKHIQEGHSFVDEQREGPYKFWYHHHVIEPTPTGVKMTDVIHYDVPFGLIGQLAHILFIRKMLEKIFEYRNEVLPQLLNEPKPPVA